MLMNTVSVLTLTACRLTDASLPRRLEVRTCQSPQTLLPAVFTEIHSVLQTKAFVCISQVANFCVASAQMVVWFLLIAEVF